MIRSGYLLFTLSIVSACSDLNKESEKISSPRIKKETKLESPVSNQIYKRGESIELVFSSREQKIDSVEIAIENISKTYSSDRIQIILPDRRVGPWTIRTKVFFNGDSETHYRKILVLQEKAPQQMTYKIINTYPHDPNDFTQGLLIKDGFFYESTGQRGSSTLKKKEMTTGKTLKTVNLSEDLFGEGLAVINDQFYQLTWTSGKGFVYNQNLEEIKTFNYSMEGWGLTAWENQLILTDESEKLYFIEPSSFITQSEIFVYDHKGKVDALNELELIDGKLYANVFLKDYVVVIDIKTGEILQQIDFSGLLSEEESKSAGVLNGIALDPETEKIYVTGKNWPKLFEISVEPKNI